MIAPAENSTMRGRAGSYEAYHTCRTRLREHARSLGHIPGHSRPGYERAWKREQGISGLVYMTRCIKCDCVIAMKPSQLGTGFRMVGILGECPYTVLDEGSGI